LVDPGKEESGGQRRRKSNKTMAKRQRNGMKR
jgi:hypothetical protein